MTEKFCKDCRWLRHRWLSPSECVSPEVCSVDLVTGKFEPTPADVERIQGKCGPSGYKFEPRGKTIERVK